MKNYNNCPICEHTNFEHFLECRDYTVSKEKFKISHCKECGFNFTNPIPNEKEIGKFYESEDYISHSNSSKTLVDKIYQIVRKHTINKKYNLIKKEANAERLLDIGSGTGDFLNVCKHKGLTVKGIEPSENAREYSLDTFRLEVYEESQIENFEDHSFDTITMWHVLEHVYHLNERVKQLKRLLKPKGKIFIAVPNCDSFDARTYGKFWAAYDVPRHLYHFKAEDIKRLFSKHGLQVAKVLPMHFDSFYVSMLSEKYKGSNFGFIKGVWTGFISNLKASGKNKYSSQIYVIENKPLV